MSEHQWWTVGAAYVGSDMENGIKTYPQGTLFFGRDGKPCAVNRPVDPVVLPTGGELVAPSINAQPLYLGGTRVEFDGIDDELK